VVVVDFGLAFVADGEEELRRMTREGVLTGTPEYMSPEQCRGSLELGPPSDVYALGVMLHEMVVGKTPFRGETALVISRHLFVPPKPMRELAPEGREVPALVEELVQRMMAKEPNDRPSAAQVRDRLAFLELGASERMSAHGSDEARMGRAARMISRGGSAFPPAFTAPSALGVAWVGARDEAFELALGANGIHVVPLDEASVIFVADGAPLADWTGRGVPVVAAATSADVATLTELLRAGAADVFVRGAGADALAKKLLRAARKR
jgi:eukaryotic-like serine/threonine-protein kinase